VKVRPYDLPVGASELDRPKVASRNVPERIRHRMFAPSDSEVALAVKSWLRA
jgi:hypothetical protein